MTLRHLLPALLPALLLVSPGLAPGFAPAWAAEGETTPATPAAEAGSFTEDLPAALERAKAGHKDLLLDFTGSDWCGWCIKLDQEVFDTAAFKAGAPGKFELVKLDFPQKKKQADEVKKRNQAWSEKLNIQGFPTIVLLDESGRIYAQTGYQQGGPEAYLKHLEELRARRVKRDEALAQAAKATGAQRAKHLDAALAALQDEDMTLDHYGDEVQEIIKTDADNAAGLKAKYEDKFKARRLQGELEQCLQEQSPQKILDNLAAFCAREGLPAATRQQALATASNVANRGLKDLPKALQLLERAIAADPQSDRVPQLTKAKERLAARIAKLKEAEAPAPAPAPAPAAPANP